MTALIVLLIALVAIGAACWIEARYFQSKLAEEHGKLELTRAAFLDVISRDPRAI